MPETIDTAREIINIKRDIREIKQTQEVAMHFNREKYERLVSDTIAGNVTRAKAFLEVDGFKTRKEIQDVVGGAQATVWRAIDHLEKNGLIYDLEQTKAGSPIYAKPSWAKTLRIDDYVREKYLTKTMVDTQKNELESGNSSKQQSA